MSEDWYIPYDIRVSSGAITYILTPANSMHYRRNIARFNYVAIMLNDDEVNPYKLGCNNI